MSLIWLVGIDLGDVFPDSLAVGGLLFWSLATVLVGFYYVVLKPTYYSLKHADGETQELLRIPHNCIVWLRRSCCLMLLKLTGGQPSTSEPVPDSEPEPRSETKEEQGEAEATSTALECSIDPSTGASTTTYFSVLNPEIRARVRRSLSRSVGPNGRLHSSSPLPQLPAVASRSPSPAPQDACFFTL